MRSSWSSRRSAGSALSWGSLGSALSIASVGSFLSIASALSAGSLLSIASSGSVLSIASTGSALSIGARGSVLTVGAGRGRAPDARAAATFLAAAALLAGLASAPSVRDGLAGAGGPTQVGQIVRTGRGPGHARIRMAGIDLGQASGPSIGI